jgi:uncharacterized protein YaaR (DUF327 family)
MRKPKNTSYYTICNPLEKNVGTGNVTFSINDLAKFDKDFLFDQEVDGVKYNKVVSKEWVRDHMLPMYCSKKSNDFGARPKTVVFYVLKVEEIINY